MSENPFHALVAETGFVMLNPQLSLIKATQGYRNMTPFVSTKGFYDIGHNYNWFKIEFVIFASTLFSEKGLRAEIDQDRLRAAWDLWHYMVRRWSDDFGTKSVPVRKSDPIRGLSPLKHAGLILWALNKTQPIISIRFTGPIEAGAENALYVAYPNEYVVFWFVYHVFFITEMRRDIPKMQRPATIMTDHFAHSMCKLLRFETPSAFSLYMIFKSFDLYMLPPQV